MSKEKKRSYTCFEKNIYRIEKPWQILKIYKCNIKFAYQRIRYGYCDKDVWAIDWWFLNVIPNMLDDLRKNAHGYPTELSESCDTVQALVMDKEKNDAAKEWDRILSEMAFLFREANEETCSKTNPYEEEWSRVGTEYIEKYGFWGEKLWTKEEKEKAKREKIYTMRSFRDFPEYMELDELYWKAEKEKDAYRNECKEKGMELFQKWFWNLWD